MKKSLFTFSILLLYIYAPAQTYKLYAGQGYTTNIYVLDPVTMDSIKFISGAGGYRIAHCPLYNKVYSTGGDDMIYVVDAIKDSLVKSFDPSDTLNYSWELEAIVLSPDQSKLYVADESSGAIFVLNTANDSIINAATINVANEMENMVISPDGLTLYIVDNSNVLKINAATLTVDTTIIVNGDAHGIEISNDGQTIYSESNYGVLVIDATTFNVTDTISMASYFLKFNNSNTHIIGVDEYSYADITDVSSKVTTRVSWQSGSAGGAISHPNDSIYYIASSRGVFKIDATTLSLIDSSKQISFQSIIIFNAAPTGISDLHSGFNSFKAFPNPFNSNLSFELNLLKADNISISVFDINGREVRSINAQKLHAGMNYLTISMKNLKQGMYFCRLIGSEETQTIMVMKE